jgi:lysozyme
VPDQLLRWVHAGGRVLAGLVARRQAEGALWILPDDTEASA